MSGECVWIVNLLCDVLLVRFGGRMCGIRVSRGRAWGASCVGAAHAVGAWYLPALGGVAGIACGAFIMSVCAYMPFGARQAGRAGIALFLCALALSGALRALEGVMDGIARTLTGGTLAAVLWIVTARGEPARARQMECEMTLNGVSLRVPAMLDTGNLLRDPVSGLPVVVMPRTVVAAALPEAMDVLDVPPRGSPLRPIRCKTAAGVHILFVLDAWPIRVRLAGRAWHMCRAVIALAPGGYCGAQALVPASCLYPVRERRDESPWNKISRNASDV